MIGIKAKPGEKAESLVRRFKRVVQKEKHLDDIRRCERYKKPSDERREKLGKLKRRAEASKTKKPKATEQPSWHASPEF